MLVKIQAARKTAQRIDPKKLEDGSYVDQVYSDGTTETIMFLGFSDTLTSGDSINPGPNWRPEYINWSAIPASLDKNTISAVFASENGDIWAADHRNGKWTFGIDNEPLKLEA